jgi:hypothetical protein
VTNKEVRRISLDELVNSKQIKQEEMSKYQSEMDEYMKKHLFKPKRGRDPKNRPEVEGKPIYEYLISHGKMMEDYK